MKKLLTSLFAITLLLATAGYFSFIRPQQIQNNQETRNVLVRQHSFLLKTKLAIVEYIKLDESSSNYEEFKNQINSRIISSTEAGVADLVNLETQEELRIKTEEIYKNQEYTVSYLADLSNLLKEYSALIQQTQ